MKKLLYCLLLFSSFLAHAQKAYVKGKIIDQFGHLPGADITILESKMKAQSGLEGDFIFEHEVGKYTLKVDYLLYNSYSENINLKANDTLLLDIKLEPAFIADQNISISSRSKEKVKFETISPVDIITPKEISNATQVELGQILHFISPYFNSTRQTISDGTDHIDPATLHGLGPDQLLVLINGKRRHSSSLVNVNGTLGKGTVGTDFNTIPIASIDRIEILREGATSQFGSDAIAGVINIILKKQTGITTIDNRAIINSKGDGLTNYTSANVGFDVGNNSFVNITAEYRNREPTNRAGPYTGAISVNRDELLREADLGKGRVIEAGNSAARNISLQFNAEFKLKNEAEVYFFGGRSYREGASRGFYRFPDKESQVVRELFPNGFSPELLTDIQDDAVTLGIRGVKADWDIDFSHGIGYNFLEFSINNSNNASLGIASPKFFDAGGFRYNQNVTNLDFSKKYDFLEGINVAFGAQLRVENYQIIAGEIASYENGEVTFDDDGLPTTPEINRSIGSQVFPGFRPDNEVNKFRTNSSGYIDVETKVSNQWSVALAGRVENYNNFDSEFTYRVALNFRPNETLGLRLSNSTGFRAPSLHQSFFNNTSTQVIGSDGTFNEVGTFNNLSAAAEFFDIERLRPELSRHFGVGLSTKLFNLFSMSLDLYKIDIDDRIVLSSLIGDGFETELSAFNLQKAQFFTNSIDTETNGFDFSLNYNNNISKGKLLSSLSFNFTQTRIKGEVRTPNKILQKGQQIFDREERSRIETAQPNFKLNFLNIYESKKMRLQLNNTLFGEVTYLDPNDADHNNWVLNTFTGRVESRDQTFSPKLVTDVSGTYKLNTHIHFSLGINNLFNVFPDKNKHSANVGDTGFIYSRRVQQFGVQGANFFGKILLNL